MKKLSEINKERLERAFAPRKETLGVACDKCGAELVRSEPNIVLSSMPPQIHVHCGTCGFHGTMVCG